MKFLKCRQFCFNFAIKMISCPHPPPFKAPLFLVFLISSNLSPLYLFLLLVLPPFSISFPSPWLFIFIFSFFTVCSPSHHPALLFCSLSLFFPPPHYLSFFIFSTLAHLLSHLSVLSLLSSPFPPPLCLFRKFC